MLVKSAFMISRLGIKKIVAIRNVAFIVISLKCYSDMCYHNANAKSFAIRIKLCNESQDKEPLLSSAYLKRAGP